MTKPALLAFKAGDVLIVDATDAAIASGRTSASALAALKRKAVSLYSHTGLHAKVVIAGSVLFSSSANLSDSSETRLLEAGLQTDDPNALSGAVGLIEKLIETSTVIDLPYLARIRKIKVERSFNGSKSRARGMEGYRDPATWLVGVHSIYEPKNADELERIERGEKKAEAFLASPRSSVSWIRCGLKKRMRDAQRGDNLVMLSREDVNSDVEQVFRHTAVLMIEHEPNCLRIYYEDPSNPERCALVVAVQGTG